MMRKVGVVLAIGMMAVPVTGAGSALEDASESVEQTIRDPVELLLWLVGQSQCAVADVVDEPSGSPTLHADLEGGTPTAEAIFPVTQANGNVTWVRLAVQDEGGDDCKQVFCIEYETGPSNMGAKDLVDGMDFGVEPNVFVRLPGGEVSTDEGGAEVSPGFWILVFSRNGSDIPCESYSGSGA